MIRLLILLTILLIVSSCSNEAKKETHFTFPEIVDTTEMATLYFSPLKMQSATNDVGTLQKLSENADLTTSYQKFKYYSESSDDLIERKSKSKRTYSGFSIFVDTTKEISMEKPSNYFHLSHRR